MIDHRAVCIRLLDIISELLPESGGTPGTFSPPRDLSDVREFLLSLRSRPWFHVDLVERFDERFPPPPTQVFFIRQLRGDGDLRSGDFVESPQLGQCVILTAHDYAVRFGRAVPEAGFSAFARLAPHELIRYLEIKTETQAPVSLNNVDLTEVLADLLRLLKAERGIPSDAEPLPAAPGVGYSSGGK